MTRKNHSLWPALGSVLLLTLSACRFGNYSEPPKPDQNTLDGGLKSVELFSTHPTLFQTAVVYTDDTQAQIQVPIAEIPQSILNIFSDPLYFVVKNDADQTSGFIGQNGTDSEITGFDQNGNIRLDFAAENAHALWENPDCLTQEQISHDGTLDRSHPTSMQIGDDTYPIAGRLNLDRISMRVIAGDCVSDLQQLAECYQDPSTCKDSNEWNTATQLLDLYVRQSGVLKIEDVSRIKALAYGVHFE